MGTSSFVGYLYIAFSFLLAKSLVITALFYIKYIKIIMEMGMLYDIKLPKISCNTINIYLYDHTVSTIDLCHRSHFTAWNHTRVGFFEMDGYHMQDETGKWSGYGYDTLRLMARYWNVRFEYIGYDKSWGNMQKIFAPIWYPVFFAYCISPFWSSLFSYMTIPEVGEIAIHQIYRKCVEEIGDSRQYGKIGIKEKPWFMPWPFNSYLLSYSAEIPASFTFTL